MPAEEPEGSTTEETPPKIDGEAALHGLRRAAHNRKDSEISPSDSDSGIGDEDLLFFPREAAPVVRPAPEPIEEPEREAGTARGGI